MWNTARDFVAGTRVGMRNNSQVSYMVPWMYRGLVCIWPHHNHTYLQRYHLRDDHQSNVYRDQHLQIYIENIKYLTMNLMNLFKLLVAKCLVSSSYVAVNKTDGHCRVCRDTKGVYSVSFISLLRKRCRYARCICWGCILSPIMMT